MTFSPKGKKKRNKKTLLHTVFISRKRKKDKGGKNPIGSRKKKKKKGRRENLEKKKEGKRNASLLVIYDSRGKGKGRELLQRNFWWGGKRVVKE